MTGDWLVEFNSTKGLVAYDANCCYCYVYGRAARRLETFPLEPEYEEDCNTACVLGLAPLALYFQRRDLRARFDIEGDPWEDWWSTCCCPAQAVAQHELEVRERASQGPQATTEQFRSTKTAMVYPSPACAREDVDGSRPAKL